MYQRRIGGIKDLTEVQHIEVDQAVSEFKGQGKEGKKGTIERPIHLTPRTLIGQLTYIPICHSPVKSSKDSTF